MISSLYMKFNTVVNKIIPKLFNNIIQNKNISKQPFALGACTMDSRYRPISYGYNSYTKTHSIQKRFSEMANLDYKEYLHAEIGAIIKSGRKVAYAIVVVIMTPGGKFANAKPCPVCQLAIKESGIQEVWYTNDSGNLELMLEED